MIGSQLERVAIGWSNKWRSAGSMIGSQLERVAIGWYEWRSAGSMSGGQLVQ